MNPIQHLGPLASAVAQRAARMATDQVPARLWAGDPFLWVSDPQAQEGIGQRLGWLDLPITARLRLQPITSLSAGIRAEDIRRILLLGMGGSSLGPEVMSLVFPALAAERSPAAPAFAILDSTDPAQVLAASHDFPPSESLYIVSSKSGGTAEVTAMLETFWHLSGGDGSRFVAITDPGTSLAALASQRSFRATLLAPPNVGGRFSVLAEFGLLPLALLGFDLEQVLDSVATFMHFCRADQPPARNPGLMLGAVLGEAALAGRDKLTLLADPSLAPFGSWLEQLIAESSGKQGRGIIVVDGEPPRLPAEYGRDRLFVYLRATGQHDSLLADLVSQGHPALTFNIPNRLALLPEFYRWEIATVLACHILGVNAFDQPDVQDNKNRTNQKMATFAALGTLEEPAPFFEQSGVKAFSDLALSALDIHELLNSFMALAAPTDYLAINAYLPRNAAMLDVLTDLRQFMGAHTHCATTLGFGPRFLHSTGQLHKGGPASGLFLQLTADADIDLEIPGQGTTFGVLERAQALGDYEALQARGRRILRLHLPSPQTLTALVASLKG